MTMNSTSKFAPREFDDLVFPNSSVERTIRDYKDGYTADNLLLHGPPGTGKSTIARLLPALIEPDHNPANVTTYFCSQYRKVEELQNKVGEKVTAYAFDGLRQYMIMEEVDNLHCHAMELLKSVMDVGEKMDVMFILTTNKLEEISWPVRDRCEAVFVGQTAPECWFPRARKIIQQETGTTVNDDTLFQVLSTANGSSRQSVKAIQKFLSRHHRRHSDSASGVIASTSGATP